MDETERLALVSELRGLSLNSLLALKMKLTITISRLKSVRIGFVGLVGVFASQFFKSFLSQGEMVLIDYVSAIAGIGCVLIYLLINHLESVRMAQKELINDLLQRSNSLE